MPVSLDRKSVRARFSICHTGEEIGTNLSLQEKLNKDFGISLPDFKGESKQSVISYFQNVRTAIKEHERWKVHENKMALGFFSFAKLLMYRDLDAEKWSDNSLLQHHVLSSLLDTPFQEPNAST